METLHKSMLEYQSQLKKGVIQQAYRGLMEFMGVLRARFASAYPDYFVSSSLYFGYMDITFFSVKSTALKAHNLKVAVVFLHEGCRFEV